MRDLADRIRSEATIADRPGQLDRLHQIANEVQQLESLIRADERKQIVAEYVPVLMEHLRVLADLRAKVEALPEPIDTLSISSIARADVLALLEGMPR